MKRLAILAVFILATGTAACTSTSTPEERQEPQRPATPAPVEPRQAPAPRPSAPEQPPATQTPTDPHHCDDPAWWNAQEAGDPSTYEAVCGEYPPWFEEPTAETTEVTPPASPETSAPESDESSEPESPASETTESPAPEEFQQYQEETGYPHSYEEYEELPGHEQCGTACGQEPTSGEVQGEYLCEQGQAEAC